MQLSQAAVELQQAKAERQACIEALEDPVDDALNQKNKKTAGGVFLTLLKKDPRFTPDMRSKVFKVEKERRK